MMDRPGRNWLQHDIDAPLYAALVRGLAPSQLWSLLLDVFEQRATARSAATLRDQWARDGFVRPTYIDQRTLVALDGDLLAAAAAFEAIELSPLAPLGVCSVLGLASQNKIVSALRGTEVVSDPTNVLALACAERLRASPEQIVRLATTHRCVRAQPVPKQPGFAPHFRIFCLASAGRERRDHAWTVDALVEHIRTMLGALDRLEGHGYAFGPRGLSVFATTDRARVADRVASAIEGMAITRAPLEHPYYNGGLRYQISVTGLNGAVLPLVDGGTFDWVGKLTSNRRLVFVASGMGSQLAAYLCRTNAGRRDDIPGSNVERELDGSK